MFKSFLPLSLDEMKRRRDFYAAHPSADGKLFREGKDILFGGRIYYSVIYKN